VLQQGQGTIKRIDFYGNVSATALVHHMLDRMIN
jgi:hypothetical protein